MNALRSGEFYESDLFLDRKFLLRQGHRVTPALLIKLKKLGAKELGTRLESLAERMRKRLLVLTQEVRGQLANMRDSLLDEFGVKELLPHDLQEKAISVSAACFADAADGRLDDFGNLWQMAEEIAEVVRYSGGEVLKPLDVPEPEVYYSHHSVNVAAMMVGVMSDISDSVGRIQVAMGCLMHDLGTSQVPKEILFRKGPVSEKEFGIIKEHIDFGKRLLMECGEIHENVKGMVIGHHEKFNGTGYPDGLSGADIPYLSRWFSCCDVYDALTTSRAHQERIAPPIALELIGQCVGSQFDPDCAKGLVERLGVYPVGSYLLLKDERIALVTKNYPLKAYDRPEVGIIDMSSGKPVPKEKVRLNSKDDVVDTLDI